MPATAVSRLAAVEASLQQQLDAVDEDLAQATAARDAAQAIVQEQSGRIADLNAARHRLRLALDAPVRRAG